LDGIDLRELRLRDFRRHIAIVTQQPMLFDDSVKNNIRVGMLHATDEQVVAAAKKAHAHSFITENLDQGYETNVGEYGNRLSGGQRQRIALARAILRDPAILILDEATNQIDTESERLIHLALQQFTQGRITILITHRTSALALADQIVVLDAGRIIDLGTHDELIKRCDLYERLYRFDLRKSA
jgi:ABC-type multidrug transport system fused ATPase/permease subunit